MLTRLSLRKSLPLLLGIFGLMFTVLLTTWHLPTRIEETLTDWRDHTAQHLALLQSSLSDHRRLGRISRIEHAYTHQHGQRHAGRHTESHQPGSMTLQQWLLHGRHRLISQCCSNTSTQIDPRLPGLPVQHSPGSLIARPGRPNLRISLAALQYPPQLQLVCLVIHQGGD